MSRYSRRVTQPKIVDFVIHLFPGDREVHVRDDKAHDPDAASPFDTSPPHVASPNGYGLHVKMGVRTRIIMNMPVATTTRPR